MSFPYTVHQANTAFFNRSSNYNNLPDAGFCRLSDAINFALEKQDKLNYTLVYEGENEFPVFRVLPKSNKIMRFHFYIDHSFHSSSERFNCYNDEVAAAVRAHKFVTAFDAQMNMWQRLDYASVMNGTLSTPIYVLKPIEGHYETA